MSLCQKAPLEMGMVIHFSILAWRISLKEMSGCQGSRDGRVGHNCLQVWGGWVSIVSSSGAPHVLSWLARGSVRPGAACMGWWEREGSRDGAGVRGRSQRSKSFSHVCWACLAPLPLPLSWLAHLPFTAVDPWQASCSTDSARRSPGELSRWQQRNRQAFCLVRWSCKASPPTGGGDGLGNLTEIDSTIQWARTASEPSWKEPQVSLPLGDSGSMRTTQGWGAEGLLIICDERQHLGGGVFKMHFILCIFLNLSHI